jgi:hypothetical protein
LEQQAQESGKGRGANSNGSFLLVPASTLSKDGNKLQPATRYSWYYSSKAERPPYTFVDVGDRYINHGTKKIEPTSASASTSNSDSQITKVAVEEKAKKEKEEVRARRLAVQKALARKALALRRPQLVKEREELEKIFNAEAKIADARRKLAGKLAEKQKRAAEQQKNIEKSTAAMKGLRI